MPLEGILNHILNNADGECQGILQEAKKKADAIVIEAEKEAGLLCQQFLKKQESLSEKQRQGLLVNARLQGRNKILEAKQSLVDEVFARIKDILRRQEMNKQRVSIDKVSVVPEDIDFFIDRLRAEYGTEIARILFE